MRLRTVGIGLAVALLILAGLMLGARYFMQQSASAEFWGRSRRTTAAASRDHFGLLRYLWSA